VHSHVEVHDGMSMIANVLHVFFEERFKISRLLPNICCFGLTGCFARKQPVRALILLNERSPYNSMCFCALV